MKTFVAVLATIIAAVLLVQTALAATECHAQWSDYKPKFGMLSGCQIKVNGKMTPTSAIREISPSRFSDPHF